MLVDQTFLEKLVATQKSFSYSVVVDGKEFLLYDVMIAKSPTPVRRPTTRGGVYFSDTSAYKVKCSVKGKEIVPHLTNKMLGPSTDFEELIVTIHDNGSTSGKIGGILTNSMHGKDHTELTLVVVRTSL